MKNKKLFFLSLFFLVFFVHKKIVASFFESSPITFNYGSSGDRVCSAQWNPTETYLAVGGINSPTDITLYQLTGKNLYPYKTLSFGNGAYAINWTPDGKYLAIGGKNSYNALMIYKWDGTSLTLTTSKHHGSQANAVAWNPNGNTLAVGGNWGSQDVAIYSWDGASTLTPKTTQDHGTQVNALAWHPAGNKLAVSGNNGSQDLILYNWNGSTLTSINTKDLGDAGTALAWTSTGTYLAAGYTSAGTGNVILYTLNGSTLTPVTSISFGTQVTTLSWSFDDRYLAVGGNNNDTDLILYEWNGSTLTPATNSQTDFGNGVYALGWSPYANMLAVGGDNTPNSLTLYTLNGFFNGTKNNVTVTDHYIFSSGGSANGCVNFTNGCTVLPAQTLQLALLTPFSGGLDLRNTGILQLERDLYFDANVTLSSGGYLNGKEHAIYLGNNLTIPDNSTIRITSNTIIDGNGHTLSLGSLSQFLIDWSVTLTLRNMRITNTHNNQNTPTMSLTGKSSKLVLDNTHLALSSNFSVTYGQLFIHNDVLVTGTSQFNYLSSCQSYIDSNGMLFFDVGTTFSFAPYLSTNKDLIYMKDASSILYLNGATLAVTHTGLRLTRGELLFDNNITITCQYYEGSHKQAGSNSIVLGNSTLGPEYDLKIRFLNNTNMNKHGMIKYDCIN